MQFLMTIILQDDKPVQTKDKERSMEEIQKLVVELWHCIC